MNVGSSSSSISLLASNLFNKLDTKQKGYLEQSDMQTALSSLNSGSKSTDVSDVFTQLDADSDGKITKAELSSGLQTLADTLQSQLQQSRLRGPSPDLNGGPPPPGNSGVDEGFTKDQLSAIASDSSTDTKGAELTGKLAANFDAADADGNGKVTFKEAMAYDLSTSTAATTTATNKTDTSTAASESDTLNLKVMVQIMQLLQAYGVSSSNSEANSSSALSVTA
jgi:hypothetical protein